MNLQERVQALPAIVSSNVAIIGITPSFSSEASRLTRRPRRLPTCDRHICTADRVSSLQ